MLNFALVQNGIVANIFNCADDETAKSLYPDDTVIDVSKTFVQRGWLYAYGVFSAPPLPDPTHAELVAAADVEKSARLEAAKTAIVVWQTKLLMGRKLTESETALLNKWMDYIDAVTAVDTSTAPDIVWPEQP